jgi:hypothetical protein
MVARGTPLGLSQPPAKSRQGSSAAAKGWGGGGVRDYRTVKTSREVWAVIRACHPELVPFGTASFEGDMFTSYGFPAADFPLIETTWELDPDKPNHRINEQSLFWLCIPIKEEP